LVASVSSNGRTALIILEDDQMEATVTLERRQRLRIGERRAFRLVRLDRTQCGARAIQLALVVDSVSV
jgi:acetolactate synthase regulatory subunit